MNPARRGATPRVLAALAALAVLLAGPLAAQAVGTVRGLVRDDEGTAIPGAELRLSPARLSIFANQQGEFRFDSLAPGSYLLLARSPGHEPVRIAFTLGGGTRSMNVTLRRMPQQLDSILVTEVRRGLYGVVSDSVLQPIVGATVRVHGDQQLLVSDSAGRFAAPDADPGIVWSHRGAPWAGHPQQGRHGSRSAVPPKSRSSSEPIVPGQPRVPFAATAMRDLGTRLAWGTRSDIVGGEELRRYAGVQPLRRAADVAHVPGQFRDRDRERDPGPARMCRCAIW